MIDLFVFHNDGHSLSQCLEHTFLRALPNYFNTEFITDLFKHLEILVYEFCLLRVNKRACFILNIGIYLYKNQFICIYLL